MHRRNFRTRPARPPIGDWRVNPARSRTRSQRPLRGRFCPTAAAVARAGSRHSWLLGMETGSAVSIDRVAASPGGAVVRGGREHALPTRPQRTSSTSSPAFISRGASLPSSTRFVDEETDELLTQSRFPAPHVRCERYVGEWLSEPLVASADDDPVGTAEMAESLSLGFLLRSRACRPGSAPRTFSDRERRTGCCPRIPVAGPGGLPIAEQQRDGRRRSRR
jgi:hypothetical protein